MSKRRQQRTEMILQLLGSYGKATISQLCDGLEASPATVRRDLEYLEAEGLVIRTHGGAMLREQGVLKPSFMERMQRRVAEKVAIAQQAAVLIQDHETIFIAHGTTTYLLARVLADSNREVTVVTNAINAAVELSRSPRLRTIMLGGEIDEGDGIGGPWAADMLERLPPADKTFVGADGLSVEHGVTSYRAADAATHKQMAEHASQTILLADHTKFGIVRFCKMFPLSWVDTIITDTRLPAKTEREFTNAGVKMIRAKPQDGSTADPV